MSNTETNSGGIGIAGLLGVAFIVLKLCGVIHWSWLWVLAPFWIPLALWRTAVSLVAPRCLIMNRRVSR